MKYRVEWEINAWGDDPREVAAEAWRLMRHPNSTATCFTVYDEKGEPTDIDLLSDEVEAPSTSAVSRDDIEFLDNISWHLVCTDHTTADEDERFDLLIEKLKQARQRNKQPRNPDNSEGNKTDIFTVTTETHAGTETQVFAEKAKADAVAYEWLKGFWSEALPAMPSDLDDALEVWWDDGYDVSIWCESHEVDAPR